MVKYSEPLMRKRFASENSLKEAKVKALKWIGKIMCKDEMRDLLFYMEEKKDEHFPTVVLTLFTSIEEKEVRERHCTICKEFHKLYFINENCNCSECKAMAIQERMHEMLKVKKEYYRKALKKAMEEMQ